MFRVKAHQARFHTQKITEPLGRNGAHVIGRHILAPHLDAHGRLDLVYGQVQRQHAGGTQHNVMCAHLRLHQGHARQLALR